MVRRIILSRSRCKLKYYKINICHKQNQNVLSLLSIPSLSINQPYFMSITRINALHSRHLLAQRSNPLGLRIVVIVWRIVPQSRFTQKRNKINTCNKQNENVLSRCSATLQPRRGAPHHQTQLPPPNVPMYAKRAIPPPPHRGARAGNNIRGNTQTAPPNSWWPMTSRKLPGPGVGGATACDCKYVSVVFSNSTVRVGVWIRVHCN